MTEAMLSDRSLLRRQIVAASRVFFADLGKWHTARLAKAAEPVAAPTPPADRRPFSVPLLSFPLFCANIWGFMLRGDTAIQRWPRLLTYHPACLACLRHFHTVFRQQRHLKGSRPCMSRVSQLVAPMSLPELRTVEPEDRASSASSLRSASALSC